MYGGGGGLGTAHYTGIQKALNEIHKKTWLPVYLTFTGAGEAKGSSLELVTSLGCGTGLVLAGSIRLLLPLPVSTLISVVGTEAELSNESENVIQKDTVQFNPYHLQIDRYCILVSIFLLWFFTQLHTYQLLHGQCSIAINILFLTLPGHDVNFCSHLPYSNYHLPLKNGMFYNISFKTK